MIDIQFRRVNPEMMHEDEYELVVSYQHGDADGLTTETFHYVPSEEDNLALDVICLITVETNGGDITECEDFITRIMEAQGIHPDDVFEMAEEWTEKFYKNDICKMGEERAAAIVAHELWYYDPTGQRLQVDTYLNGRKVEK